MAFPKDLVQNMTKLPADNRVALDGCFVRAHHQPEGCRALFLVRAHQNACVFVVFATQRNGVEHIRMLIHLGGERVENCMRHTILAQEKLTSDVLLFDGTFYMVNGFRYARNLYFKETRKICALLDIVIVMKRLKCIKAFQHEKPTMIMRILGFVLKETEITSRAESGLLCLVVELI